jgi:hypothetical protein
LATDAARRQAAMAKQGEVLQALSIGQDELKLGLGTPPDHLQTLSVHQALEATTQEVARLDEQFQAEVAKEVARKIKAEVTKEVARQTQVLTDLKKTLTTRLFKLSTAFRASTLGLTKRIGESEQDVDDLRNQSQGPSTGSSLKSGVDPHTQHELKVLKTMVTSLTSAHQVPDPLFEHRLFTLEADSQALSLRVAGNNTYEFGGDYYSSPQDIINHLGSDLDDLNVGMFLEIFGAFSRMHD